jgi:hypothetical protein
MCRLSGTFDLSLSLSGVRGALSLSLSLSPPLGSVSSLSSSLQKIDRQ